MWNFIALLVVSIFFRKKSFFLQFYGNLIKKEGFSWSKPLPGGPWKLIFFSPQGCLILILTFQWDTAGRCGSMKIFFWNFKTRIFSKYFWKLVAKKFRKKKFFAGVSANLKKRKKNFENFFQNFSKKKIFQNFFFTF